MDWYTNYYALRPFAKDRLLALVVSSLSLEYTALPRLPDPNRNNRFYRFDAYKPPLRKEDFMSTTELLSFVRTVTRAVTELHDKGNVAHLDIRLENVCFNTNDEAVLIDVDRSCPKLQDASKLFMLYSRSSMYKVPGQWTCEKLDWRQFGILLTDISPGSCSHYFINKLTDCGELLSEFKCILCMSFFCAGEYDAQAHQSWELDLEGT